jgi:hypothetical protein
MPTFAVRKALFEMAVDREDGGSISCHLLFHSATRGKVARRDGVGGVAGDFLFLTYSCHKSVPALMM